MKKDIRDCFYCSRTPIGVDCDKVDHDCNKCKYYRCKYCEYKKGCVKDGATIKAFSNNLKEVLYEADIVSSVHLKD